METLQEAVANAGYETSGYAGYYSSGFGGYGTGGAPTVPRGFILCMQSSRFMNLFGLPVLPGMTCTVCCSLESCIQGLGFIGGSIVILVSHPTCPVLHWTVPILIVWHP